MNKISTYHFPSQVKEASAVLAKLKNRAVVLAGGTMLTKSIPAEAEAVVDIRNLGLDYIKAEKAFLRIGAGVTFTKMLGSDVLKSWAGGVLYDAAFRISSHLVRNMGTVGGNIVRAFPFNHLPPILLALDAQAVVMENGKSRTCPFAELYDKKLSAALGRTALLVEIKIPAASKNLAVHFEKFAKAASMWESIALVCCAVEVKNGKCARIAVAVGSAVPRAKRLPTVEKLLLGNELTAAAVHHAAASAVKDAGTFTSVQASAAYKSEILPVLVERAILSAAQGK